MKLAWKTTNHSFQFFHFDSSDYHSKWSNYWVRASTMEQLSRADIYHTCTKSSGPGVRSWCFCLIIHDFKMLNNKNSFMLQIITPLETCNILSFPNIVIWFLTSCNSLSTLIASISKTRSHNAICHRLILSWAIEEKVNWDTVTG